MLRRPMTRRTRTRSVNAVKHFPLPLLLVGGEGSAQALVEVDRGLVAEDVAGLGDVGERVAHVARARIDVEGFDLLAGQRRNPAEDLVEADALAAGYVEGLARGPRSLGGEQVGVDRVVDVGEVARMPAGG